MDTALKIVLLTALSSKMPTGTSFSCRVASSPDAPQTCGTIVARRAGWFHRHGTLRLIVAAKVAGKATPAIPESKEFRSDAEGTIVRRVTWKRRLITAGTVAGIAKIADDTHDAIQGPVAAATPSGRRKSLIIGWGAATTWLIIQRGQDVKLPEGTILEVR